MGHNTIGSAKGGCTLSSRSWAETNVSLSFTTCTGSICLSSQAISLFINLPGVVMNFIWRVSRAPKGLCLHFCLLYHFIFSYTVILPLLSFNLCVAHWKYRRICLSWYLVYTKVLCDLKCYKLLPATHLSLYFCEIVQGKVYMWNTKQRLRDRFVANNYVH